MTDGVVKCHQFFISTIMNELLLHSCCAPCSCAIIEHLLHNDTKPVIFYSNSNIYPYSEYEIRREELKKLTNYFGVTFLEDEYDHQDWLNFVAGLEQEPERGSRCQKCFLYRLRRAAKKCKELNINQLTTSLSSSRWKDFNQIVNAGKLVESEENVTFVATNWRKGGLQERRNQLLKDFQFYNQLYCGCEFSVRK